MKGYLARHAQVLVATLGQFARHPAATAATILMIGVTIALPTGLYVGLHNLERLSHGWHRGDGLTVYLHRGRSDARALAAIRRLPGVRAVRYTSPQKGLAEFERRSGFGKVLTVLRHNPLPGVVTVSLRGASPARLHTLAATLRRLPDVGHVQSNRLWLERLNATLRLGRRLVMILAVLLGLALVLILGNTTRVAVANRADEIEVIRLVGGTDAFIRRPFLYTGALIGAFGALCAWALITLGLAVLSGPVQRLDTLYASHYGLVGLGGGSALRLVLLCAALGWLGARLAVGRRLARGRA